MLFNTTGFSAVVFQLRPTKRVAPHLRHHRLQPRGVSTSPYEPSRAASPTPPASAAWCFNFALRTESRCISDTTVFSRVVLQLRPTNRVALHLRHHRLQPRGVSTSPYEPSRSASPDTTGFSRVVFQFQPTTTYGLMRHHRLQPRGASVSAYDDVRVDETPPASAAWCFNFALRTDSRCISDTTGFSRVVFQLRPTNRAALHLRHHRLQPRGASVSAYDDVRDEETPPASAAWCFNFPLR